MTMYNFVLVAKSKETLATMQPIYDDTKCHCCQVQMVPKRSRNGNLMFAQKVSHVGT